jgi:hypothetical protein
VANPLRGMLVNQGISILHPGQNDARALVRPAEGQPVSEFRLGEDMQVYGLPDETLLTFEGSGIETFWELVFPAAANPYGLDSLADVLLTFDLSAQYSPALYAAHLAASPVEVRRWALVSGAQYAPKPIKDLAGSAPTVTIEFDLKRIGLPGNEKNRKVKNMALFFFSPQPLDVKASLIPEQPAGAIEVTFKEGLAQSNLPPDPTIPPPAPQPLNTLLDAPVEQIFRVVVAKSQNPGISFSAVTDLVLAVEYAADL